MPLVIGGITPPVLMSDTGTEGEPSAQSTEGMVKVDFENEVHARILAESGAGVSADGRITRPVEFEVINGELWTCDYRFTGGLGNG